MKLQLLGSKQKVKGFDIDAHAKFVQGTLHNKADTDTKADQEEDEEAEVAKVEEQQEEEVKE